jgi:Fe-S-cluster-containing hydrogenase component 2
MDQSKEKHLMDRRAFMKTVAIGGSAVLVLGNSAFIMHANPLVKGKCIRIDFEKCTGCHTCETVCVANNFRQMVNGETIPGLLNPKFANIRVHHYNPDVDVPLVCAMCPDAPCIEACVVEKDEKTGRKALYRDPDTGTIKNDEKRCITCGTCIEACKEKHTGILVQNKETSYPSGMCTLCNGDPQCVKHCPYDAISLVDIDTAYEFFGKSPDFIAHSYQKKWYHL